MEQALKKRNTDDLGTKTHGVFEDLTRTQEPVLFTSNGESQVVAMAFDVYQKEQNRLKLLEALAKGEVELGRGQFYEFEDVMADARAILES